MQCLICEATDSHTVWHRDAVGIEKCANCGVLFTADRPTEEALVQLYDGEELIKGRPGGWTPADFSVPAWKLEEHQGLLDQVGRLGVDKGYFLDVGCFDGTFLSHAKQRGFDVVGVEPHRNAFEYVRKISRFEVIHGSLGSAHFPADRFAVVSLLDVIEHVADPVSELKEVFRVLRPGGTLVLTTPNVAGLPQRVVKTKRALFGAEWCPIDNVPWHLWGFTRGTLALCVQKAGFEVKNFEWLKPSLLSTNLRAGSTPVKRLGLWLAAYTSLLLAMSDRFALFAQKSVPADKKTAA